MAEQIYFVGIGMGNRDTLTIGAWEALQQCDCLIGAQRMLDAFQDLPCEKRALTLSEQIASYIQSQPQHRIIGVVFSGDLGFYSGAKRLRELLREYPIKEFCGVSSVSYFCAKLHQSWEDVHLLSLHGRVGNLVGAVQNHEKTFILAGQLSAQTVCRNLCHAGFEDVSVSVGERLSYPDERVTTGTARGLFEREFYPLSVLLIQNPKVLNLTGFGLSDGLFLRGDAPMTKSEVRAVSLARLQLQPGSVAWDVGSGTGSVAVEMALQAKYGSVYAVEKEEDAVELIRQNRRKFSVLHLSVVQGEAPAVLDGLPAPDSVFIGGCSGNLEAVMRTALYKNPKVRIVINAITLETLHAAVNAFASLHFTDVEISQVSVARANQAGPYHMMLGQNPVYVLSGQGAGL